MKQLDQTIFDEAGLSQLTPEEKERMLAYAAKTLETRVGIRLSAEASPEQLAAFAKLSSQDDEQKLAWLETSFPNYESAVEEELIEIKDELADMAQEVLNARQ